MNAENNTDIFLDALLKTLNSVYEHFRLIKNEGSIYVIGYNKDVYNRELPKEGGDLDIFFPEKDIVIVDRSCVVPFTREQMERQGGWRKQHNDPEWLRGHTAGCLIFSEIIKDKRQRGVI